MHLERREYQTSGVTRIGAALRKHRHVLAVSPTGSGKTEIASMFIAGRPRARVLWLAHRSELIGQACARLRRLGVECGTRCTTYEATHPEHVDRTARVQVGSVQTIIRQETLGRVDLIVIDEAHHAAAASYQEIVARYPKARVLGLTATPVRTDSRGLGDFFEHMIEVARPSALYDGGWLRRPKVFTADDKGRAALRASLRGAKTSRGDYTVEAAHRAVIKLVGDVVREAQEHAAGLRKVVFAASIEHSKKLAVRFRRAGVWTEHLDGETPADERAEILAQLAAGPEAGGLECVCNYDVLSEGWDLPSLGCVVVARPTKSIGRFLQMIGRVQRPTPGAPAERDRKVLLDHGDNVIRLNVFPGEDHAWSLENGFEEPESQEEAEERIRACSACGAMFPHEPGLTACPACGAELPRRRSEVEAEEQKRLAELTREKFECERLAKEARAQETKICADPDCGRVFVRGNCAPTKWARKTVCHRTGGNSCTQCTHGDQIRAQETKICADSDCGRVIVRGDAPPTEWLRRRHCSGGDRGGCECGRSARAQQTKICADPYCGQLIQREDTAIGLWNTRRFCKGIAAAGQLYCENGNKRRAEETKTCADPRCGRAILRGEAGLATWKKRRYCVKGSANGGCAHGRQQRLQETKVCADPDCERVLARGDQSDAKWEPRKYCDGSRGLNGCRYGRRERAKQTKICANPNCGKPFTRGRTPPSVWILRKLCSRPTCRSAAAIKARIYSSNTGSAEQRQLIGNPGRSRSPLAGSRGGFL